MEARDCKGRLVSLLNEPSLPREPLSPRDPRSPRDAFDFASFGSQQPFSVRNYSISSASSPYSTPPDLQQADSYDSNSPTSAPISPMTPSAPYDYPYSYTYAASQPRYDDYVAGRQGSSLSSSTCLGSYEAKVAPAAAPPAPERPAKRYPCRFRTINGCDRTFTTSGHASRHSKIHTAEKGVQCTFPGCEKKFTRGDNMKQHLETHFKNKSRPSTSNRVKKNSHRATKSMSSATHRVTRRLSSSARKRPSISIPTSTLFQIARDGLDPTTPTVETPLASPARGSFDLRSVGETLRNHGGAPAPRNGLDALAIAAAQQGG